MMPAKVEISRETLAMSAAAADAGGQDDAPCYATSFKTSGEWVNAVLATAPYLDTQGLHEALAILDRAIGNVQQAKALEGIITGHCAAGGYPMPHLFAAELVRAQVCEQQEALLRELHELRASSDRRGGRTADAPSPAVLAALARAASAATPAGAMHDQLAFPPGNLGPSPFTRGNITERVLGALGHPSAQAGRDEALKGRRAAGRPGCGVQTLSTSLQLLTNEDPDCLFIVRRMNKLGFKASRKLKQHFSAYGTVVRVLVAHSTVRQHGDPQCHARRRPSSLGFVQMAAAASVREVLAAGPEQEVDGSLIRVQKFERQHAENAAAEDSALGEWDRQLTESSSASMSTTASTAASAASTAPSSLSVEVLAETGSDACGHEEE